MKKIQLKNISLILFATVFIFTACEKDDPRAPEVEIAEDDALAADFYEDVFAEVDDAMQFMEDQIYYDGKKSESGTLCKQISVEYPNDSTYWPRTVTIDYGEGCTGPNGRTREGKIIIVVDGRYIEEGYSRTVTFEDFYINDHKIEGQKSVVNEGINENGNIHFSVILEGGKVIKPDGQEITKEYNRIREWVTGSETPFWRWDDEYMITGSATGINRGGIPYTRTIIDPLHYAKSCPWVKSGSIEIEAEGRETAYLDYGDGSCDRLATVTVGEKTWTIRLHP